MRKLYDSLLMSTLTSDKKGYNLKSLEPLNVFQPKTIVKLKAPLQPLKCNGGTYKLLVKSTRRPIVRTFNVTCIQIIYFPNT